AGRARGEKQRLVYVAKRGVDLRALLGLIHHPAHLATHDVRGDADAPGTADVERARERGVVARVERQPLDLAELVRIGLLETFDVLYPRKFGKQLRRLVRRRPSRHVVEEDEFTGVRG